jgi:sec-independent protein translocase protein TatB
MFELGTWGEILIIGFAALILIGPKELPTVLRACGRWAQKLRQMTFGIRQQLRSYIHEGEFEEYRQQVNDVYIKPDAKHNSDPSKKQNRLKA